jgi:hypothetical protein
MSHQQYSVIPAEDQSRTLGLRVETPVPEARLAQSRHRRFPEMRNPVISIVAVYEHDLNLNRAQLMQEELTRRLGHSFNFSVSWWKLKSLWHPKMLRVAADAVAQADIILFALLSGGELPQTLTKWLEETLQHGAPHRVSLLALLETGGMIVPRLSSAEIYLSRLARQAGLDCLCYSDSVPLARVNWRHRARLSVAEALHRLL